VSCPSSVKKSFLPVRGKDGTLIFPTGSFVGVYYSKELKYAKSLGYTVIPLCGYLFEKKEALSKNMLIITSRVDYRQRKMEMKLCHLFLKSLFIHSMEDLVLTQIALKRSYAIASAITF